MTKTSEETIGLLINHRRLYREVIELEKSTESSSRHTRLVDEQVVGPASKRSNSCLRFDTIPQRLNFSGHLFTSREEKR